MKPAILVVGAGSIGARHARNLARLGVQLAVSDVDENCATDLATEIGARAVDVGALSSGAFDAVVLATPTSLHHEQALAVLATGAKLLVEKPLAVNTAQADELSANADGRVMVGFNLRLHKPIATLIDAVHAGRVGRMLSARLWFGYHLPSWRPGTDYRLSYSARADLSGGVLLDAIHEVDLAIWLAVEPLEPAGAFIGRVGDLEIDVEDTVRAQLVTSSGIPLSIDLDYLSRRYRRGIEVIGTAATIRLDWARNIIEIETDDEVEQISADAPVADSYVQQAERFVSWINNGVEPPVDAEAGAKSVRLVERLRDVAR